MTDFDPQQSGPILLPEAPPEHRDGFWSELTGKLGSATAAGGAERIDRSPAPATATGGAKRWPLAAAAALVAIGGLVVLLNVRDEPAVRTEVVQSSTTQTAPVPLDGPDDGTGAGEDSEATSVGVAATPGPRIGAVPVFRTAPGVEAASVRLPTDGGVPENAIFLGTSEQLNVSWFAVSDPKNSCDDQRYTEIRSVDRAGTTRPVHDPRLWFSGDVSLLSFRPDGTAAAWIVACGTQVELYAATLTPGGQVDRVGLVWVGTTSPTGALMLWDGTEVSLNAIGSTGQPFNVTYEMTTGQATFDGAPLPHLLEEGAPSVASGSPLGAEPAGRFTYWYGIQGPPPGSPCVDSAPSAESLWLHNDAGTWSPALVDSLALGEVTALALDSDSGQVAFADACGGTSARIFLGTLRADGRIGNLRQFALAPYAPGFIDQVFFVDATTLRFEIDNASRGFGRVRFDFRFEDGFDRGVVVQID